MAALIAWSRVALAVVSWSTDADWLFTRLCAWETACCKACVVEELATLSVSAASV